MLRNHDLEQVLFDVTEEMQQREQEVRSGAKFSTESVSRLTELREVRWTIKKVLLNRQIEASKKVVDFSRWLNADGALRPTRRIGKEPSPFRVRRDTLRSE
jgi:hypothetical protein